MPHVIAVAALKGGAGKTTVALALASEFHLAGHKTLLVDADSQRSAATWASVAAAAGHDAPPVVAMSGANLRKDVERVGSPFAVVVIDSPPRLAAEQRAALMAAHLVLLPVTPGGADVWALKETLALVEEARGLRPELRAAIVCNRMDRRTALSASLLEAMGEAGVPVLKSTLGQRVAFAEAMTAGQGVCTYAPGTPSAKESHALAREVLRLLKG